MKIKNFGAEIQMIGITREQAIKITKEFLQGTIINERIYPLYIEDKYGEQWKIAGEVNRIRAQRQGRNYIETYFNEYEVKIISPILKYEDIRKLRKLIKKFKQEVAINKSKFNCGIHTHITILNRPQVQ